MDGPAGSPRVIDLGETARLLALPEHGVRALAEAGYLHPIAGSSSRFVLGDVKAFLARIGDVDTIDVFSGTTPGADPTELIDALDGKADDMAHRVFDIFQQAFPDAAAWPEVERTRFVDEARRRFEAILAITEHGDDVELVHE